MKDGVLIIGATAASFEVTENGIYACIVTINGCSSGASNSMIVINVGLQNLASAQLEIFPVPSNGLFTASITWPSNAVFAIQIYNSIGSLVYEQKDILVNGTTRQTIDMQSVPSGIYMIKFTTGTDQIIRKMVINRD